MQRCILYAFAMLLWGGGARALAAEPRLPAWLVAPHDPSDNQPPPSYFERHAARVERNLHFLNRGYTLELNRERDGLRLYGDTPGRPASTVAGVGLFSLAVVGTAHTPAALRFAFDRALHVGPAIFDGGGMGAGFGGAL